MPKFHFDETQMIWLLVRSAEELQKSKNNYCWVAEITELGQFSGPNFYSILKIILDSMDNQLSIHSNTFQLFSLVFPVFSQKAVRSKRKAQFNRVHVGVWEHVRAACITTSPPTHYAFSSYIVCLAPLLWLETETNELCHSHSCPVVKDISHVTCEDGVCGLWVYVDVSSMNLPTTGGSGWWHLLPTASTLIVLC